MKRIYGAVNTAISRIVLCSHPTTGLGLSYVVSQLSQAYVKKGNGLVNCVY